MISPEALAMIETFQDEDCEAAKVAKQILSELLIEVIQQNVGDHRWTLFAKTLADQIYFMSVLQID